MVFTTLAHHIDVEMLREAFHRTRKDGAPGVDKVTAKKYAEQLEENLKDLYDRLRERRYKAPPVERAYIAKEDGSKRPIGKPSFEDKVVQRAVVMLLEPIYEQIFHEFSHGFRKGHSPHQALHELWQQCHKLNIGWIIDADVSKYFDNVDRGLLRSFIKQRVNDGGLLRLIGKWLNAGVMEEGVLMHSDKGTPQGGVVSPMLSNIFLHYVLDEWFVRDVKPKMKGGCFLLRFADDFIIGCEHETDARRIMAVLPKRFSRYRLSIHPKKTRLVDFRRPGTKGGPGKGSGTFDFLGFTHYWGKSRRGKWIVQRKTAGSRFRRTIKALWQWCRRNRHLPVRVQHQKLCQKIRGHYQYYGIRGNFRMLSRVPHYARIAWRYWLSHRGHRGYITWEKFGILSSRYPFPSPRIVHRI